MHTRKDYLDGKVDHSTYYRQFVDEITLDLVEQTFTKEALQKAYAKEEWFNTISLRRWDALAVVMFLRSNIAARMVIVGGYPSQSYCVCTLKEAAKMLIGH